MKNKLISIFAIGMLLGLGMYQGAILLRINYLFFGDFKSPHITNVVDSDTFVEKFFNIVNYSHLFAITFFQILLGWLNFKNKLTFKVFIITELIFYAIGLGLLISSHFTSNYKTLYDAYYLIKIWFIRGPFVLFLFYIYDKRIVS